MCYEKGIPFRIFGEKITPYHSTNKERNPDGEYTRFSAGNPAENQRNEAGFVEWGDIGSGHEEHCIAYVGDVAGTQRAGDGISAGIGREDIAEEDVGAVEAHYGEDGTVEGSVRGASESECSPHSGNAVLCGRYQ
jgi:hypothetical protein